MDDYHLQRLKELGLGDEEPEEYDIIARKWKISKNQKNMMP